VFQKKLQHLKLAFKDWNKNIFGNIHKVVEDHKKWLVVIQLDTIRSSPSYDIFNFLT